MLQTVEPASPAFWTGLSDLLRTLTPYGVIALLGFLYRIDRRLTVMRLILTGEGGNNGIKGSVEKLGQRVHNLANDVQAVETKVAVHEQRLNTGGI